MIPRRRLLLTLGSGAAVLLGAGLWPAGLVPARASSVRAADIASIRVEKAARRLLLLGADGDVLRKFDGIQLGDPRLATSSSRATSARPKDAM